ncbi:hypothetical protein [Saccharothrix luteola]|nr:hypothetical protein [Saccharothrix luteola]
MQYLVLIYSNPESRAIRDRMADVTGPPAWTPTRRRPTRRTPRG